MLLFIAVPNLVLLRFEINSFSLAGFNSFLYSYRFTLFTLKYRMMGGAAGTIGGLEQSGKCLEKLKIVVFLGKHVFIIYLCEQ